LTGQDKKKLEDLIERQKKLEEQVNEIQKQNQQRNQEQKDEQLAEKQKAKYTYGLLERQFRNTFNRAAAKKGITGENLLKFLEARLDNTVYRMGMAQTRSQGRQLVSHGHINVNGKLVNIPSYQLKPGDIVSIREKSKSLEVINSSVVASNPKKFNWINVEPKALSGTFMAYPERDQIPENIKEQLIVELYSK
jgi:small subunit ribosomal protein S4